jgi:lipopolysaccharide export system permease protein
MLHDRYIFAEWFKIFLVTLAACTGLLLIQQIYAELKNLIDDQATISQILTYYSYAIPAQLPLIIPVAFLVSLLYALGSLHRNHELTALRVAGLGWFQITRTLWATALSLCALTLYLNASLIPQSVEAARSLRENLRFEAQARILEATDVGRTFNLGFDNQRARRVWMFNTFSAFTNRGRGATLHELDADRREVRRLHAREARFEPDAQRWVLLDGRELLFDPDSRDVLSAPRFDRIDIPVRGDDPATMLRFEKRAKDLSLAELSWILSNYTVEEYPRLIVHAVRYHALIAGSLACLVVIGLAIPFAVSGVRVNPAVGVSKSFGLFLVYWLLLSFSGLAGDRGLIEPWLAGWLPNLSMLALSGWLFLRMR